MSTITFARAPMMPAMLPVPMMPTLLMVGALVRFVSRVAA